MAVDANVVEPSDDGVSEVVETKGDVAVLAGVRACGSGYRQWPGWEGEFVRAVGCLPRICHRDSTIEFGPLLQIRRWY